MQEAKKNVFMSIRQSRFITFLNKVISSPVGIAIIGISALLSNMFSLELAMYIFVGIFALYVCIFADDFLPLMPLFVFCYIATSKNNNPALSTDTVFNNNSYLVIICILAVCLPVVFIRIGLDKNMGYKKLFTQKRKLVLGMLILGVAYMLSGIGSKGYLSTVKNNLIFSALQFLSIFLLYFIFSATIKWNKASKSYFAWFGVIIGIVVSLELLNIYIVEGVVQNGEILRGRIDTGWGHYNNIGALIAMSIPFAFYLACKKNHNYIYIILGTILLAALFLTCSRGSIVGGAFIYAVSFVFAFFKAENKKSYRITSAILIALATIIGIAFLDTLVKLFEKVPTIINSSNESLSFNDSSRFKIYKEGFNAFLKYPIFGESFYPKDFVPYDWSIIESFSSLIPPRWHNTIIQILASCGLVGMLAYSFHRFQTIKLFVKKRNLEKTFIGLSIAVLLITSLLDCHFFNIGPTLFYSMALVFAEKINSEDEKTEEINK